MSMPPRHKVCHSRECVPPVLIASARIGLCCRHDGGRTRVRRSCAETRGSQEPEAITSWRGLVRNIGLSLRPRTPCGPLWHADGPCQAAVCLSLAVTRCRPGWVRSLLSFLDTLLARSPPQHFAIHLHPPRLDNLLPLLPTCGRTPRKRPLYTTG